MTFGVKAEYGGLFIPIYLVEAEKESSTTLDAESTERNGICTILPSRVAWGDNIAEKRTIR